jgi:hypothetical protein
MCLPPLAALFKLATVPVPAQARQEIPSKSSSIQGFGEACGAIAAHVELLIANRLS